MQEGIMGFLKNIQNSTNTSDMKQQNTTHSLTVQKILKKVFTPYSIAASVFWTICCIYNISQIFDDGFTEYLGVSLFGYALFICLANAFYSRKFQKTKSSATLHTSQPIYTPTPGPTYTFVRPYDQMDGHEFEYFCGNLLQNNGFSNVEVTKGSGDQGIDIIAYKDGIKYGIQCKCYSDSIGNKAVQEAFSGKAFYNCHVAAVLTNRYFTKSATELAEKNGVLLWNRDMLENLIKH